MWAPSAIGSSTQRIVGRREVTVAVDSGAISRSAAVGGKLGESLTPSIPVPASTAPSTLATCDDPQPAHVAKSAATIGAVRLLFMPARQIEGLRPRIRATAARRQTPGPARAGLSFVVGRSLLLPRRHLCRTRKVCFGSCSDAAPNVNPLAGNRYAKR